MPRYTFTCSEGHTLQKYTSVNNREFPCESCSNAMIRQPPKLDGPVDVHETVDKYMNIQQRSDQSELVKQRRDEYYWTVEVPRFVNSGTYTVETMLEMGWIYVDEKDEVQICTTPPHKR